MMLLALSLVLLPRVLCSPRIDPNNLNSSSSHLVTAPASNTRSLTLAAPYTTSHSGIKEPQPTGTAPSANDTSAECTIKIPSASVDYWLLPPLEYTATTLVDYTVTAANTSYDMLSASAISEPLDVTSLLLDYGFTDALASSTSVVTVDMMKPIPSPGIIATSDVDNYIINPPPATAALGTFTATSSTPFVYFSAYEIETRIPDTNKDGKVGYTTSTATFELASPYVYEYDGKDLNGQSTAVGDVPKAFQLSIPHSSCFAGTWQASVTVLIVVELVYGVHVDRGRATPLVGHIESSVSGLDFGSVSVAPKAHAESSVSNLDLTTPTPGVIETSKPSITQSVQGPPQTPSSVAVGSSTDIPGVTDLPGLFSHIRSYITAIAHLEQSTTGLAGGQGEPTALGGTTAQAQENGGLPTEVYTFGSETVKFGPSMIVVGSQTLAPGAPPITIGGTPISLAPSATAVVYGGSTALIGAYASLPVVNIQLGSSVFTAAYASATGGGIILPGGGTLLPGSATVVNGETISMAPSGSAIVVGGVTSSLPQMHNNPAPPPLLTIGSLTITGNAASQYSIAPQQTLTPGGTVTFSGTIISLGSSADYLVIGGTTQSLPTQTLVGPSAQITAPPLTIGNGVYTPVPGSGTSYLIGGSLLTPGGLITVANTRISLASGASYLIVNGVTTTLASGPMTTNPPLLTIGTSTITAQSGSGSTYVIAGQTLTPGGVVTVSGTVISLSPSATVLVIINSGSSTSTETLFPATQVMASTVIETGTFTTAASAGATPSKAAAASSHGAAYSIKASGTSLSLFTLVLGYIFPWI